MYDIEKIRKDFPIFDEKINGKRNTFLDTAASSQKPKIVLDKMNEVYAKYYANVHRGAYLISEKITQEFELSRKIVQSFINAHSEKEIIFTRGATEGINLVASTWGKKNLKQGDEVLLSVAEHHANLVPWQALRDEIGFTLKFFELNEDGSLEEEKFLKELTEKTKLVAVTAMSNVLGTIFPIKKISAHAHNIGAKVLVDACQFAVHHRIDVNDFDCDFLVFSGHKTYGPTGIGVLFGRYELLNAMPPYQFGGDMIKKVTYEKTTFTAPPARFEAGTPAFVQAIGLGEALLYMQNLGLQNIEAHEYELVDYTMKQLKEIKGLKLFGTAENKGGVFSFVMDKIHPQDLAFILDKEGISIRTGHHCAQPLVNKLGYQSIARASLGLYSDKEDIDTFIKALNKAKTFF